MLEQELPEFTEQEQAREDELELTKAKKPKVHTMLPFERGSQKVNIESHTEALPTNRPSDSEVVIDLRSARLEAEKAFSPTEIAQLEEEPLSEIEHNKVIDSVWHRIEVDDVGHTVEGQQFGEAFYQELRPENPVELDYADANAGNIAGNDDEVAVASGQLAVSTLEEEMPTESKRPGRPATDFSGSLIAIVERLEGIVQSLSQGFGTFTAFDVVLWATFLMIVIAIIFAIRA